MFYAAKRYFCVREQATPTNVIFALSPLPADRLPDYLAKHKAHLREYTDKRYFGCQNFVEDKS